MTKVGVANRNLLGAYLNEHRTAKLHIGCGDNLLDGWLNTDLLAETANVLCCAVTEPFPFVNNQFDYIFSEHVIEHMPHSKGSLMLKECFRVLKPNGKIRISTPDLAFLIDLYNNQKSDLQESYIKWTT